ncbi:hypothetical protein MZD87_06815 [Pediococcus pentosaceus]|uniref:hypothetical protein n=1 Tax=Pediococcus pentosaceus TaxID=1255 RepID=UPI00211A9D5A|nr:hypothetical protein [Pediococcus pentosaceus]MCQ9196796.1 hypothetical protein [Pediococcus pentosaceus]
MKSDFVSFFIEFLKILIPPYIAWRLATNSAKQSAKANKTEMREQLRISSKNNEHVKNQAYKLQFCIKELERREYIFEKNLSAINVLQKSVGRYLKAKNPNSEELKMCASQLMEVLHELIFSIGTLQAIVRAASPRFEVEYIQHFDALKKAGEKIEKDVYEMSLLSGNRAKDMKKIKNVNNNGNIAEFLEQLKEMRNFIMQLMFTVIRKMG